MSNTDANLDAVTKRLVSLLPLIGRDLPKDAAILDFGCGSGRHVYGFLDLSFTNVQGFDVQDRLELRQPAERAWFQIAPRLQNRLPYDDNTFDLVFSDQVFEHIKDQVTVFRELHRITKPNGAHLHIIPSPYYPVERHIRVPLGNIIVQPWWYRLWALLGLRRKEQKGKPAKETADENVFFFHECLNYIPSSSYVVIWRALGFNYRFVDQEFFDSHWNPKVRLVGKLNRLVPIAGWLKRVFKVRHVVLTKRCIA